ncbi:hypothetical protein [Streptomyces sp. NPDC002676]
MNPVEYAAGDDPLYGANPLRMRGMFPPHWGDVPAGPSALRCWIESNALRDGAAKGDPPTIRAVLERRREDPSIVREEARVAAANRLRLERLALLRRDCP